MEDHRPFVLKVSGAILSPENRDLLASYSKLLLDLLGEGYRPAVVVGGGPIARSYIAAARACRVGEAWLDILGIEASRLNALLLISTLKGRAYPYPPRSIEEFLKAWTTGKIVVCGGFQPGQSTNAVSAVIAESIGADTIINASRVDAVYDKDPKTHPDAKPIKEITAGELRSLLSKEREKAGRYELMDELSLNIVERSNIKVVVVDGRRPELIAEALKGRISGTLILPK